MMEDNPPSIVLDGKVVGIKFSMATCPEICTASISDSSISHASQLSNPFLGLPLEFGRCESCGTSEAGKCEGHFGYIELPVPIYHPSHVSELKRILSLVCLSCLKMKKTKFPSSSSGLAQRIISPCCEETSAAQVSIREVKTADGASYLALKVPKSKMHEGFWNFLDKYGYHYDGDHTRALLPCEVMEIIKRIPLETKRKLAGKGYFPQDGYVLKYLPVPPNCLSVPVVSDGVSVMSSDPSITILRKLLRKVEIIKSSRSGEPNFESHQVEANDLQSVFDQYLQVRGTAKAARDIETRFGVNKELNESSTKAWLEKMRTLFIRKGSGFSSRSVITGDGYRRINEVGIPLEVAQRITFEERVSIHNISYLQKLVDENLCLTYTEGASTYSLREGSKGHTYLKLGQIVHRRIMDGDIVFINRPPTTHKHSLQALVVYIHNDHTVKINPVICGPLGADFDGDCVHLFYPQSPAAKAEVVELFSVEKQLLSSHSGNLNLQLTTDSMLSLKMLFKKGFLDRAAANQMAMFLSLPLPHPAVVRAAFGDCYWTSIQILQCALPLCFDCTAGRYLIKQSEILEFDIIRDALPAVVNEIAATIFFGKGPQEALYFFDVIQPFLMESLFANGFSVGLQEFSISKAVKNIINKNIGKVSPLLGQMRSLYKELVAQKLEKELQDIELPVINFAFKSTKLGDLIDSKSKSAVDKVVQQIGFLGQQLFERGRFYSKGLAEDVARHFHVKCFYGDDGYPSAEYGLLKGCFFHGLDPYEALVHSISTREIIVRSSRGLSEPGTLFKNLMAILRDIVISYDGTVRNVCSNSVIQFEYGIQPGDKAQVLFPAGEPVGVLAATSMSNPAYKAVLDSSPSSNSSWELMKEILLCKINFRNEPIDRRVVLYLNDCDCGKSYCREKAAYVLKNQLRKISLKDAAVDFVVEYQQQRKRKEGSETDAGLVGHIHLEEVMLEELKINMTEVFQRCQQRLNSFNRKKKLYQVFRRTELFFSESCSSPNYSAPCVTFLWPDGNVNDLDQTIKVLADMICPVLLDTIIQGDPRISSANIIWVNPDSNTWVRNPSKTANGELALDIILEKDAVKQSGDAWRIVLDSCLPVLHLIDTRRSIPYAIKQVQELLGISCTFDQAIQRLASSVKMVAKGVLREHLILLASSMTCGGNLVGFNTGGYKALSRQLNIQVPFTDATLFTPRKCFEKAAEKCHADTLSSIVASCSWGKHVAVGTGSRFDIVWDPKEEIKSKEIEGMDVYMFLNMVKNLSNGEEENNACLGEDIDDLLEDENEEWGMSPQHTSGFDAVFDENFELLNGSTSNGWGSNTDQINQPKTNTNDWSGWGQNKSEKQVVVAEEDQWESGSSQKHKADVIQKDSSMSGAWESGSNQAWKSDVIQEDSSKTDQNNDWGIDKSERPKEDSRSSGKWKADPIQTTDQGKTNSSGWDAWGKNKLEIHEGESQIVQEDSWNSQKSKAEYNGADVSQEDPPKSSAWGAIKDTTKPKSNDWSSWGKKKEEIQDGSKKVQEDSWNSQKWKAESKAGTDIIQEDSPKTGAWGAITDTAKPKSNDWSSWGKKKEEIQDGSKKVQEDSWNSQKWNAQSKAGADVTQEDSPKSIAWGAVKDSTTPKANDWSSWGKKQEDIQDGSKKGQEGTWNSQKSKAESMAGADVTQADSPKSSAWGAVKDSAKSKIDDWSSWGRKKEEIQGGSKKVQEDSWNSQKWKAESMDGADVTQEDSPKASAWGAVKDSTTPKTNDWSSRGKKKEERQDGGSEKIQDDSWSSGKKSDNVKASWGAKGPVDNSSWGKPKSPENQTQDSQNDSTQAAGSRGWDSQISSANSDSDRNYQWGKQGRDSFKKNRFEGSQGWGSNAGDGRRNRPMRPPGPRLDLYSPEEQDIRKEIEPIVQSIRRIMQMEGYNDGDPLPADDQLFVLENVFEHHPDKETKMGAGIDHVMVNRHSSFQESRCLYVVLKDGTKEDFSYRKCLENLVRKKYPDLAESFNGKYFRKPSGRRDQTPNPAGEQTPTQAGEQTPTTAGEQTPTPAGDQTSTPVPMETNE